ncbi:hypothetical protein N7474_006739 [Penicillium riverlandense]|uniref:uncharacterized protein n=1 Tax=Penicillium riverlandense TaxID=1903569 RepID=UPI002548EFD4|nr:uncharacterized protein N7474_006739 [Penicillium riverlandense]KAJ5814962.1 hypothetical protein N7474_006739 [Penicillium riverlandense]
MASRANKRSFRNYSQRDKMAPIQNLPVEILVYVYECLDDVDDVLHLARSCKYLNSVFNPLNTRLKIFSTIIQHAPQHAYDFELCDRVRLYGGFSEIFYSKYPIREDPEGRKLFFSNNMDLGKLSRELPAESVWNVVCRWHAMRLLFNLYCDSSVQRSYSTSVYPNVAHTGLPGLGALAREETLQVPSRAYSLDFCALDAEQKKRSYHRFYKALTAHWVAVEALWLTGVQVYETAEPTTLSGFCGNTTQPDHLKKRSTLLK